MKTRILSVFILIIFFSNYFSLKAQDDFEKWLKKDQESYNKFLSEEDKQFLDFLKNNWSQFKLNDANKGDVKPKPEKPPVFTPTPDTKDPLEQFENKIPEAGKKPTKKVSKPDREKKPEITEQNKEPENKPAEPSKEITKQTSPEVKPAPIKKPEVEVKPVPIKHPEVVPPDYERINYFGEEVALPKLKNIEPIASGNISNELISNYWIKLSNSGFKDVLKRALEIKENLILNDWGYYLLLSDIASETFPGNLNSQNMLVWFLLNKSGYKARIVRTETSIFLSIPSKSTFYGVSFVNGADASEKSYLFAVNNGQAIPKQFYSYKKDHPEATKYIDLNLPKIPRLTSLPMKKELSFNYLGVTYKVETEYDKGVVDYFEYYPTTELKVYFKAALSPKIESSMVKSLAEIIKDKPEPVAANMILRFVQTAFDYETDQQNFGREKPLFKDEIVHYKYSDCEDRAILFSYLIEELLGLKVIGLDYPGHVCTAVKFKSNIKGDTITYKNNSYLICDPTYIGSYIGMCMPAYKNKNVENFIELN